jgi:hypothetical protein
MEVPTIFGKIRFFQQAAGIGMGTARVAVGVAVMQSTVDWLRKSLQSAATDPTPSITGNIVKNICTP